MDNLKINETIREGVLYPNGGVKKEDLVAPLKGILENTASITSGDTTLQASIDALTTTVTNLNPFKMTDAASGTGYLTLAYVTAKSTLSGATTNIAVQVPSGAKIIGCLLRVDTAATFSGGGATWGAAYNTGSTQAICANSTAATKNTKVQKFFDANAATDITTAATDITVSADAGAFTGGVITAVVVYQTLTNLTSV